MEIGIISVLGFRCENQFCMSSRNFLLTCDVMLFNEVMLTDVVIVEKGKDSRFTENFE